MPLGVGAHVDRYELLAPLGEGGQGSVWRARDRLPPHEERALKLVPLVGLSPVALERSRREAHLLAQLRHPALVRCHGLFESYEHGVVGLVLDLADGVSLRGVLADRRFDVAHRQAALRQVVEALAYLHGRGLVHRDVKLENIIVTNAFWSDPTAPGTVRLVDFGITAAVGNPQGLTDAGHFIGTLPYMAPETLDPTYFVAETATPAIDVFALGVLGCLLLRGEHPTGLSDQAEAIEYAQRYRVMDTSGGPWAAESARDRWDAVLRECIQPRAARRLADAGAVLRALDGAGTSFTGGAGAPSSQAASSVTFGHAPPSTEPGAPPPTEAFRPSIPSASPGVTVLRAGARPRPAPTRGGGTAKAIGTAVLVLLVLGLIGTAGVLLLREDRPRPAPEPSAPPPAPTTPIASTQPRAAPVPAAKACECGRQPDCGSTWRRTPGPCDAPTPQGRYRLRFSWISVEAPRGRLWDAEPTARVCFRVAGKPTSSEVCVANDRGACPTGPSLDVDLREVTYPGPGIDVAVRRRSSAGTDETLATGHIPPFDHGTKQRWLCEGYTAAGATWSYAAGWSYRISNMGMYLDEGS